MRAVLLEATFNEISTILAIFPPSLPVIPTDFIPNFFPVYSALITFSESPLVLSPKATSPSFPSAFICLENTQEKSESFDILVITDVSVVNAIAGRGGLSSIKRFINSAAICWASAALPPLPNRIILFPWFIASATISTVSIILSIFFSTNFTFESALSKKLCIILSFI